jgi:sodium/hydrogen antiporter
LLGRQLAVAVLVGVGCGWLAMRAVSWAGVHRLAEEDWFPLASIGLALAVLGLTHQLGGTGVLAAFLAGLVFAEKLPDDLRQPIHEVHRSMTKGFVLLTFLAFGILLPIDRWWPDLGLAGVGLVLWVLLLRRLPVAFAALRLVGMPRESALFIAWAGPLGAAGIYYLAYAHRYGLESYERLFSAGTLAICASVLVQAMCGAAAVRAHHRARLRRTAAPTESRVAASRPDD